MNLLFAITILTGAGAAGLALYGRYRVLPALFTGPTVCRLPAGGCQVLFRSKNAALLGVPNSLLGLLYYALLVVGSGLHWPLGILVAASTLALAMTLVLARILIKDRLECRICWTGHVANTLIWILLFFRLFAQ